MIELDRLYSMVVHVGNNNRREWVTVRVEALLPDNRARVRSEDDAVFVVDPKWLHQTVEGHKPMSLAMFGERCRVARNKRLTEMSEAAKQAGHDLWDRMQREQDRRFKNARRAEAGGGA